MKIKLLSFLGFVFWATLVCANHSANMHFKETKSLVSDTLAPPVGWTNMGYSGSVGTFFADINGDGMADAIAVNNFPGNYYITVRFSNGREFNWNSMLTTTPFFGTRGTFFADVNGDGKADGIAVNDDGVKVGLSNGLSLEPATAWTQNGYWGSVGTYFADVNGDRRADAIVVNSNFITVRLSDGSSQFQPNAQWTSTPFLGTKGTYFADVNGDGKADAIAINDNAIEIWYSDGSRFVNNVFPYPFPTGIFYGSKATFFQDINGDGNDDLIRIDDNGVSVNTNLSLFGLLSLSVSPRLFSFSELSAASFENTPNYMSDVNGDGKADLITGTNNTLLVRLSRSSNSAIPSRMGNFSMILSSDPQWPWVERQSYHDNAERDSISTSLNQKQVSAMNNLYDSYQNIKGVIINGDLTAYGDQNNDLSEFKDIYANLKPTMFVGLGNHDYSNNLRNSSRALMICNCDGCYNNTCASGMIRYMVGKINQYKNDGLLNGYTQDLREQTKFFTDYVDGSLAYSWDLLRVHFVQLQNYPIYKADWKSEALLGGWNHPRLQVDINSSLDWLEDDLKKAYNAGQNIILNFHDPDEHWGIESWGELYPQDSIVKLKARFKNMLTKYKVSAVFVGHYHNECGVPSQNHTPPSDIYGNTPVYYCGSSAYSKFLLVEFIRNQMRVSIVNSETGLPVISFNNLRNMQIPSGGVQ